MSLTHTEAVENVAVENVYEGRGDALSLKERAVCVSRVHHNNILINLVELREYRETTTVLKGYPSAYSV